VLRLSVGDCNQFQLGVTYRMFARLLLEKSVPAGCATFWLSAGAVETLPDALAHEPHVPEDDPFPNRQLPAVAAPAPSSVAGTSPAIKSPFVASPVSTYCFVAACIAATGLPGSVIGPVIVP